MRVGSLFSGIGGIDLGLERAGMEVVWQSEIDPYASKVLAKHWPDVPNLGDVTLIDWSRVERPDLICGGYPCQPFSLAGARRGDDDERHLWPYFAGALRVLRPRWALLENVPGHLSLGFDVVQADLAELGYDTEWECLPAAAFGAPHLRWRIIVVAHTDRDGGSGSSVDAVSGPRFMVSDTQRDGVREQSIPVAGRGGAGITHLNGSARNLADAYRLPLERASIPRPERHPWSVEPDICRVADGVPARVDRLRTLGNAVVPQMAEYVGRQIMAVA